MIARPLLFLKTTTSGTRIRLGEYVMSAAERSRRETRRKNMDTIKHEAELEAKRKFGAMLKKQVIESQKRKQRLQEQQEQIEQNMLSREREEEEEMKEKEMKEEEEQKQEDQIEKKMKAEEKMTKRKTVNRKKKNEEEKEEEDDDILNGLISSDVVTDDDMNVFVSQLKSVFDVLDKNGEGEIAETDLKRTVQKLIRKPSVAKMSTRSRERGGKFPRHNRNKAIKESMRHRRPTNFAKAVFSRADADYSRSIDFVEFTEFFTILLHAIFSSIDLHDENEFDATKFKEFAISVFGDQVFLKQHELKYPEKSRATIIDHRVKKAMLRANGNRLPCDKLSRKQCIQFIFNTHCHSTSTVFNALSHDATENAIQWKIARGLAFNDISRVTKHARQISGKNDSDDD